MNKTLALIIVASILSILTMTLLFVTTDTLGNTSNASKQAASSTKCQVQIREAKRADDPSMVEDNCIDYIDDSSFETDVENSVVYPIIS
jgi:hypothetical protein